MRITILSMVMVGALAVGCDGSPAPAKQRDPGDIVNVCFQAGDKVPAGNQPQTQNVYTVPVDKWLIVTDVHVREGINTGLFELPNGGGAEVRKLMGPGPAGYSSSVGLKFAPGSTVVSHGMWRDFHMTGHLVPK